MDFDLSDTPMPEYGWDEQNVDPVATKPGIFRSAFARALHFNEKPQKDDIHESELDQMEIALRAFASGESMEELRGQLDGQRALVKRLKGNLKDNRSKLRATLKDLKAARKKLAPLKDHVQTQRKELFEQSMRIDSQRIEIKHLRQELETAAQNRHKFSMAHATLSRLSQENQHMKDEILELRIRHRELENMAPADPEILRSLNADIAALKAAETEHLSEIAFLKSENEISRKKQTELMQELIELRKTVPAQKSADPIDTAQIRILNEKLEEAAKRETILEQRLEILTRDLDIVNQTNDMLRGRISKMETLRTAFEYPKQAVGF